MFFVLQPITIDYECYISMVSIYFGHNSMGYATETRGMGGVWVMPANEVGKGQNVWGVGVYGLRGVWVKRGSSVVRTSCSTASLIPVQE